MRILVLDAEPSVRHFVDRTLTRRGDRVLVAATPGEAWALAFDFPGPLHAALIDTVPPGEAPGAKFADDFKKYTPDTRIVFITDTPPAAEAGVAPFRDDVLTKPFTTQQLLAAIDRSVHS